MCKCAHISYIEQKYVQVSVYISVQALYMFIQVCTHFIYWTEVCIHFITCILVYLSTCIPVYLYRFLLLKYTVLGLDKILINVSMPEMFHRDFPRSFNYFTFRFFDFRILKFVYYIMRIPNFSITKVFSFVWNLRIHKLVILRTTCVRIFPEKWKPVKGKLWKPQTVTKLKMSKELRIMHKSEIPMQSPTFCR